MCHIKKCSCQAGMVVQQVTATMPAYLSAYSSHEVMNWVCFLGSLLLYLAHNATQGMSKT